MASSSKTKADEKAALKVRRKIRIELEADESTLQRIAALLVFSTIPYEIEEAKPLGPLPWELPDAAPPPELEINVPMVQREIIPLLQAYVKKHSKEAAEALIMKYGAPKLAQLTPARLMDLYLYLKPAEPETPA